MIGLSRHLLAFGLALLALGPAQAQAPGVFSSVSVDVTPLRALGLGPVADVIRDVVQAESRTAFAGRVGGRGPRLVVRITALSMRSYAGSGGGVTGGGSPENDYLEGEALVVGPRGEVLARYPQLYAQPASYGGAWYTQGAEGRRVVALARNFTSWLRRTVG